jgi:hypothetical protein
MLLQKKGLAVAYFNRLEQTITVLKTSVGNRHLPSTHTVNQHHGGEVNLKLRRSV